MIRLAAIVCLLLAGCATKPPVETPAWFGTHRNACVPEAASMVEGLRGAGIEARVILLRTTAGRGHAIVAYLYPDGENTLWGWDSYWSSIRLRAWWASPESIANAWLRATRSSEALERAEVLQ